MTENAPPHEQIGDATRKSKASGQGTTATKPPSARQEDPRLAELAGEVEFWRTQYEDERERLTKLWVAYKDLESAYQDLRAGARDGDEEIDPDPEPQGTEAPGVLAIEPPDTFEVMAESPKQRIEQGRGANYPIVFVNRGNEPASARIRVASVPDGWSALTTEEEIELDPQASQTVFAIVRTPTDVEVGTEGEVRLHVETSEGEEEALTLSATVAPPPTDREDTFGRNEEVDGPELDAAEDEDDTEPPTSQTDRVEDDDTDDRS